MLKLYIPCDSVARAVGADQVADALQREAERRQLPLDIQRTSSRGLYWLEPLLEGKIWTAFGMTEPDVASSDARNIRTRIRKEGGDYVIDGR